MQRAIFLFFILLSLVVIRAYGEEPPQTPSSSGLSGVESESGFDLAPPLPGETQTASEPEPFFLPTPGRNFFAVRLETYQPTGQGIFTDQSSVDLSSIGSTLLPTITYGTLSDSSSLGEFQTTYGLEGNASFATQEASLVSSTGLLGSGKFQTAVLSLKPLMRFHWRTKQKIFTRLSAEFGYEQVNLYGAGAIGSMIHSSGFFGYGLGLEWNPLDSYGVVAEYYTRTGTTGDQSGWSPTTASYQMGLMYFF